MRFRTESYLPDSSNSFTRPTWESVSEVEANTSECSGIRESTVRSASARLATTIASIPCSLRWAAARWTCSCDAGFA